MKKDFLTVAQGGIFLSEGQRSARMNRRGGQRSNREASSLSCHTSVITPCAVPRLLVDSLGGRLSRVCAMCLRALGVAVGVHQSHYRHYRVYECAAAL